jgi:UDP-glucuronate 4-epimerase
MNILVTGCAGFIGSHVSKILSNNNYFVYGIDSLSDYYDIKYKLNRLEWIKNKNFSFFKINILDLKKLNVFFTNNKIDLVIHLAAQPGVLFSLKNPYEYIQNNITAYLNILETCRKNKIKNIIYSSSSSVYGKQNKTPFKEEQKTDTPLSVYAATKITDELISFVYSNVYNMNFIGLRFFTVYGPWGRPDMSPYIFVKKILENKKITLYDNGKGVRDFTYIDDVSFSILKIVKKFKNKKKLPNNEIFNIGCGNPIKVIDFIKIIEGSLNIKAKILMKNLRKVDMKTTYSNSKKFLKFYKFKPKISLQEGIDKFIDWYKKNINN